MHDEDAKRYAPKKEEGKEEEEAVEKTEEKVAVSKPKFDALDLETPMNIMVDEKFFDQFKIK